MITDSLVQFLLADAAVSALVGASVFPALLMRGASLPAIELEVGTHRTGKTLGGASGSNVVHYTLHCFGQTYSACEALVRVVYGLLSGFTGTMGGGSGSAAAPDITVQTCWVLDVRDGLFASPQVATERMFWKQLEVEIRYEGF